MRPGIIQRLMRRIIDRYGRRLLDGLNRCVARYSLLGNPEVFDASIFPWTRNLEDNWPAIRGEAEAILRRKSNAPPVGDISPDHRRLDHRRTWRVFFLWGYGYRADQNCLLAPRTARRWWTRFRVLYPPCFRCTSRALICHAIAARPRVM